MSDLISRQAAIDAIVNTVSDVGLHDNSETARYGATYRQQEILTILESLPSADRPQGWVDKAISIIDAMQKEGIIDYEQAWEFRMRARMKGADDD